jgi:hypothetical protein
VSAPQARLRHDASRLGALEIDHVIAAVTDLPAAARELAERHGLTSIEGGRHPGWGTANRIVPLGEAYLELVAVVDAAEADASAFGRWVASAASTSLRPAGWAVRTGELDRVAARLGVGVLTGSRVAPDGRLLRWRLAGTAEAAAEPPLPFFIEWGEGVDPPGHAPVVHPAGLAAIAEVELSGDAARLASWLGEHRLPLSLREGPPAVTGVVLEADGRRIALR